MEAYRAKIKTLHKLGRDDEVLRWLEKCVLRDGQNTALRLLYAEELGLAKRFNDANSIYKELAQTNATPEVYRGMFQLYAADRQFDRLLSVLDSELGAAAGKKDGQEGDADAAARSCACWLCCALIRLWCADSCRRRNCAWRTSSRSTRQRATSSASWPHARTNWMRPSGFSASVCRSRGDRRISWRRSRKSIPTCCACCGWPTSTRRLSRSAVTGWRTHGQRSCTFSICKWPRPSPTRVSSRRRWKPWTPPSPRLPIPAGCSAAMRASTSSSGGAR